MPIIRPFDGAHDSYEELTAIIRCAYKALLDMDLHFWATRQTVTDTIKRVEEASFTLVAEEGEQLVGTIALYTNDPSHRCEAYRTHWHFGQFAVEPSLQKTGIGGELLLRAEELARANGGQLIALDTAEPAMHLIDYYEKRGYKFLHYQQWEKVNYRSVVMGKRL